MTVLTPNLKHNLVASLGVFVVAVPLSVGISPVLVVTRWRLFDPRQMIKLWKHSRIEGSSWIVTCFAIAWTNLLLGLSIGLVYALILRAGGLVQNGRKILSPAP